MIKLGHYNWAYSGFGLAVLMVVIIIILIVRDTNGRHRR